MKIHRHICISGSVQGVGFRMAARIMAESLGLTGYVQNEDDGSVIIEAEGNEESVKQFLQWCHNGPPHAVVKAVSIREGSAKNFATFEIR